MLGLQTVGCLHDIPLVRASTDKLQNLYAKAESTSQLVGLACSVAEGVISKSIKIAVAVANPIVPPLREPARMLDGFAAQKILEFEAKYPVINTPTNEIVKTFNEKTEPARQAINSVKETTTSTIQKSKETVSHVASATVHKAADVADSVFSFCEAHGPGKSTPVSPHDFGARTSLLSDRLRCAASNVFDYFLRSSRIAALQTIIWFRLLVVSFLHKIKATNDAVLSKFQHKRVLSYLPTALLIRSGVIIQAIIQRLTPDDRTLMEVKRSAENKSVQQTEEKHHARVIPSQKSKVTAGQSVLTRCEETTVASEVPSVSDKERLYARIAASTGIDHMPITHSQTALVDGNEDHDIALLHERINPSDIELLYSKLSSDTLPNFTTETSTLPLTADQQQLHAQVIGAEIERQHLDGVVEEDEIDL